jgi:chemotaxis protein MotB
MAKFISTLDAAEEEAAKIDAQPIPQETPGPLHGIPENAANIIAGNVSSSVPRERVYDDSEAKIVQGRLWLISFTDLFSLMLCFFLMLYSMKEPDEQRIKLITGFLPSGMHSGEGIGQAGTQQGASISHVNYQDALNLDYLQGVLKAMLSQVKVDDVVSIVPAKDHLKLTMNAADVFNGNGLSETGTRVAKALAGRLATLSNRITIVGIPSDSGGWTNSIAQAAAFAEMMRDAGYRKSYVVVGEGDGRNDGIEIRVEADDGQLQ